MTQKGRIRRQNLHRSGMADDTGPPHRPDKPYAQIIGPRLGLESGKHSIQHPRKQSIPVAQGDRACRTESRPILHSTNLVA
jgi:hypothetical protein